MSYVDQNLIEEQFDIQSYVDAGTLPLHQPSCICIHST